MLAGLLYGACALLLVGAMTGLLKELLPDAVGGRLARNSEAWLVILVLGSWIQFVRPRITDSSIEWPVTVLAAAVCFGVGYYFWEVGTIAGETRITTLNEGLFALAFMLPYVMIWRPLPRWIPWMIAGLVLVVTVLLNRTGFVTDLAETIGFVVLLPIGLDVVDRGILDPEARTVPLERYAWYAFLVVTPVLFALIETNPPDGLAGEASRYMVRLTEGFVATLVLGVYFAVGLGRTGVPDRRVSPMARPSIA